ncbi:MAG: hypothetical protein OHK0015_06550 [Chloroflexi bacterium OHK40]
MAQWRRTLALIALLVVAATPTAWATRDEPPPGRINGAPAGPGDIYLALGDSLATGDEEPSNSADEGYLPGYPAYLDAILDRTQPILLTVDLAVSGETSSSMRASGGQLEQAVAFIAAQHAQGRRVSPVTLSIGGNDMVGTFLGQSTLTITDTLPLFRANLEVILDTLLSALTENGQRTGDLIVMNYYNPYPGLTIRSLPPQIVLAPGQEPIVTDVEVPRFNQIIAEEAAERGIPIVDAYGAFLGRIDQLTFVRLPYNFLDLANIARNFDYHPREAGHQVLARGFAEASGYPLVLPRAWVPMVK